MGKVKGVCTQKNGGIVVCPYVAFRGAWLHVLVGAELTAENAHPKWREIIEFTTQHCVYWVKR